jgi:hypothetical protein
MTLCMTRLVYPRTFYTDLNSLFCKAFKAATSRGPSRKNVLFPGEIFTLLRTFMVTRRALAPHRGGLKVGGFYWDLSVRPAASLPGTRIALETSELVSNVMALVKVLVPFGIRRDKFIGIGVSADRVHGFGRFNLQNTSCRGGPQVSRLSGSLWSPGRGGMAGWSGPTPGPSSG